MFNYTEFMLNFLDKIKNNPKIQPTLCVVEKDGKVRSTTDPDEMKDILQEMVDDYKEKDSKMCEDCEGDCCACKDIDLYEDFYDDEDDEEDEEDGELVFDGFYEPEMAVLEIPASGVLAIGVAAGAVLCGLASVIRALRK